MTKNKLLFFGIILIFNLSCSNDDSEMEEIITTDNFNIENYHGIYAQYAFNLSLNFPDYGDNLIKFEYDNQNRIIKRIGNVLVANPASGIGGVLHDSLYSDLVYLDNKIYIEKKIAPFGGLSAVPENGTTITLNNNRMIQKITYEEYNDPQIDTTSYTYANDKLISYIKTSNNTTQGSNWEFRNFEESNLYYTNGNLDSIVTIHSYKPNFTEYTVLQKKETKIFSGYDNVQNPFRKLQVFKETFNRSLSKNNFTEYKKTSNYYNYPNNDFYQTPTISETYNDNFQDWNFAYDENGEWIYNEF